MCPGTLRENTERPITIEQETNWLAGVHPEAILMANLEVLETEPRPAAAPPLWDGQASRRVVDLPAGQRCGSLPQDGCVLRAPARPDSTGKLRLTL